MSLKCDLHLHSCLSPCGDKDMTPANIAGMAHLAQLDVIALTDHNSCKNLPATADACRQYNIRVLCGIEVCTSEEIHLLCYFKSLGDAMSFSSLIEKSLPPVKNKAEIYGEQLVMNSRDQVTDTVETLLIVGCGYSLGESIALCHAGGGVCCYAHIDRQSFSVLSVLGTIPTDYPVEGVEIYDLSTRDELIRGGFITTDTPYMSNSDAHALELIGQKNSELLPLHPLYGFVKSLF